MQEHKENTAYLSMYRLSKARITLNREYDSILRKKGCTQQQRLARLEPTHQADFNQPHSNEYPKN